MNAFEQKPCGEPAELKSLDEVTLNDALNVAANNGCIGKVVVMNHLAHKPIFADDIVKSYVGLINNSFSFEAEAILSLIKSDISSLTDEQHNQVNQAYNDAVSNSYDVTEQAMPQYNGLNSLDDCVEMTYEPIPKVA